MKRDITISINGVQFLVTVLMAPESAPDKSPRRWCVRVPGSKQELDEVLDAHVLEEIDRRIHGGMEKYVEEDDIPFDVPTQIDVEALR